jgi:hypothetical protein
MIGSFEDFVIQLKTLQSFANHIAAKVMDNFVAKFVAKVITEVVVQG